MEPPCFRAIKISFNLKIEVYTFWAFPRQICLKKRNRKAWGDWVAQSGERVTLDLRVLSSCPMFGIEVT